MIFPNCPKGGENFFRFCHVEFVPMGTIVVSLLAVLFLLFGS